MLPFTKSAVVTINTFQTNFQYCPFSFKQKFDPQWLITTVRKQQNDNSETLHHDTGTKRQIK